MAECQVLVQIGEPFAGRVDEEGLRKVVEQTLAMEGVSAGVELGLVITDDETIRQLNLRYRGKDEATDVLCFALHEPSAEATFINPPDGLLHLGEVILCYPQAAIQAEEHHHPLERELALLAIHGVLHLLGYDDVEPQEGRRMRAREEEILNRVMT